LKKNNFYILLIIIFLRTDFLYSELSYTQRFAFIASNNYGGKNNIVLKYTNNDAEKIYSILNKLSGIEENNIIIIKEKTDLELIKELNKFKLKINNSTAKRKELIFYYSGHADDKGLLLGNSSLAFSSLKNILNTFDVDLKVVILDSCFSGSFLRTKGGARKPSFLIDDTTSLKGYAFLSSSSASETSQESDKIKGSYFTYYLLSGLKGAADFNFDNKVTLNEIYQFAYNQTIASTELSNYGVQHPSYELNLSGAGELVLADLAKNNANLSFSPALWGRVFIRDENNNLIAEFNKIKDKKVDIALDNKLYYINIIQKDELFTTEKNLSKTNLSTVNYSDLRRGVLIASTAKGDQALVNKKYSLAVNFDEKYFFNNYFKYKIKPIYFIYELSFNHTWNIYTQGLGAGIYIPLNNNYILNFDFLISNTSKNNFLSYDGLLYKLRTNLDIKISDALFLQAGPTINFFGDAKNTIDNILIKNNKAKRLGFVLGFSFMF